MSKYSYNSNETELKNQKGTRISSKLIPSNPNTDDLLIDAVNVYWGGYKMYDHTFTYTGDVLSYIETQLDLRATADGDVWDNIKDNVITSQVTIYTSSNSTTPPLITWNSNSALDDKYDDYTTYNALPNGWARQIEDIEQSASHVFMSTVYEVRTLENKLVGYHDPHGTVIYLPGESGLNGNFKSTVFVRSSVHTPDTPANGANYNTGLPNELYAYINAAQHTDSNRISYNNGAEFKCWSDGIPAGNEALWATTAVITDTNPNDAVWTTPRQMTDTATYDVEFSNVNVDPGNPTDNPDNWYDPIDDQETADWPNMIWRAERVCTNGIWGDWTIIRIKGEKGVKGDFVSTVFTRTTKDISNLDISETVTPGSYNEYDHPIPPSQTYDGETIVWTDGTPSGPGALWTANKTFSLDNENTEWSYPQLVADTDIYDVEFSPSVTKPDDPSTSPSNWIDPTTNHYKDHTEQVPHIYNGSWEDMIWRAERTKEPGEEWGNQTWIITKIKGEDGTIPQPMDYYQSRYALTDPTDGTELSNNQKLTNEGGDVNASSITKNGLNWNLTICDATNKNIWQTSRRVTWSQSDNSWVPQYDNNENWEEPFMLNGLPGESQPIHPCLLYKWGADPKTSPTLTLPTMSNNSISADNGWKESPGAPSDLTNIFLWMIQGEYKIVSGNTRQYQKVSGEDYWTDPICLSGADGKPGADGDDIEFIYLCPTSTSPTTFDNVGSINVNSNNPANWYNADSTHHNVVSQYTPNRKEPLNNDYLGPSNVGWQDHPTGVDITHKYEYAAYRRTSKNANNQSYWEKFSTPFAWSIYGENGIDGDGVEYIYYRTETSPANITWENGKNPSGWYSVTGDYQKDDYPCIESVGYWDSTLNNYVFRGWTDEPQGVGSGTDEKYEYVAIRKKGFKINSTTEKEWKPFSTPKLWSNYAQDGRSINMVLETDNDNVTVGIDEHGKVNNIYQDNARISLNYNGIPQETSKYSLILSLENQTNVVSVTQDNKAVKYNGSNIIEITTNENGQYVVSAHIPQEFPLGSLKNVLIVVLTATTLEQIGDIPSETTFTRTFKVSGVQLSIDDIYKLNLSTTTPHRTPDNEGFEKMHIALNSFTSTSVLTTNTEAKNKGLFVCYISTNGNTQENANLSTQIACVDNISDFELPSTYNKHTFYLKYNPAVISVTGSLSNYINNENTIQLDEEEATAVYDGANGVDSQSEEYIYLLTDDIDFFTNSNVKNNKYYLVGDWKTNISSYVDNNNISYYQYNDYPFITNNNFITLSGTSTKYVSSIRYKNNSNSTYTANGTVSFIDNTNKLAIGYWTDNPQGVSEEYPYEFRVSRRYLTSATENDRWQAFGTPQPWANWGHTGEDGDGVEYIYRKMTDDYYSTTNTRDYNAPNNNYNPIQWCTSANYNTSEYILDVSGQDTWWTDNPQEVDDEYKYEYVSIRKYSTFSNNNFRKLIYNLPYLKDGSSNSTTYHIINDTDADLNKYYGYLLTSTANLGGTYKTLYSSLISYASSEHLINNNENTLLHCAEQFMTAYNAYWSGSAPNYGWTNPKPYTNEKISRLCFYIYRNRNIINDNQKLWSPYYQPTLWAKYGEQGRQGDPGGSGLVFDFTNDNLQLGVNAKQTSGANNGKSSIKGANFTYTMINLYSGDELISYTKYKLTYTNNPITVTGGHKLGYIFKHDNSNATTPNTYYASLTKTINNTTLGNYGVGNTSGWSNGYYFYIKTKDGDNLTDDKIYINDTQQIQFQITYNGKNYYKSVNVSTLHWGKDGEPAETFELFIPNSEIMIDAQGNTTPTSITPMVKHVRGGEMTEIISYSQLTTTYNTNGNFFTMGYLTNVLYASSEQTNPITPKSVTSGTSNDSGSSTRGDSADDIEKGGGTAVDSGSGLDLEDPTQQGSKIDDEEVTEKINGRTTDTVTYIGNGVNSVILGENFSDLEWVKYSLWYTESGTPRLIDEEVTYAISDGVNGRDGKYIEYIYYRPEGSEQINWNATGTWNGTTNPYVPNRNNSYFDNRANPSYWTVTNQSDWISGSYTGSQNWTIWTDNPSGIDSTYQWEYVSQRTYDGENWSRYSIPQAWSHYGENGRDGDGVEYIFARTTDDRDTPSKPSITSFIQFKEAQSTEWGVGKSTSKTSPNDTTWSDNSQSVSDTLKTQWVCVRKYKQITNNNKQDLVTTTTQVNVTEEGLLYLGVNTNNKLCKSDGTPLKIGDYAWFAFTTPSIWSRNIKGDPGSTAYVIDWTNDQINLAVDEDGYIIGGENGQLKETSINIESLNGVFGSNPTIKLKWLNEGDDATEEHPANKLKKNSSDVNNVYVLANLDNSNVTFYHNNENVLKIKVGAGYSGKAYISPEGIELKAHVRIYNGSTLKLDTIKILRICGQHIAQDGQNGQNAVTYELAISPNAISLASNGMLLNPKFNIGVIKYDGDTITNLTSDTLPENLLIQYSVGSSTRKNTTIGNNVTITASGSNDIVFYLVNNNGTGDTTSDDFDIDVETVPVVRDGSSGGQGPQGFTGAIVRMRGEYVHNKNTYYGNGEYKKNTGNPQYDGTSPLYKDIVTYTWTTGENAGKTKYYTPKSNITGSYITSSMSNSYLCTGSSYVHYQYPATSGGTTNSMWVDATQYEFVATRLLYADQGLVNQLSTHDLIVTNSKGYPVAGLTSGRAAMTDANGTTINSPLTQNLGTSWTGTNTVGNDNTDPVRIFAGKIYSSSKNSYSLTYAPFRVTQSGVAYMSNAVVVGDITANSLKLGPGSFWTPISDGDHTTLPDLHNYQTAQFIILTNSYTGTYANTFDINSETIVLSEGASATLQNSGHRINLKPNKLYQFISVNYQWNATEITLKLPDGLKEYYDCINDVKLYGSTLASYIYWDTSGEQRYWSYVDTGDKFISYYAEQQNNSSWPVKTQKVYDGNTLIRQTNSYFRQGTGVPDSEKYITESELKGKKVSIEFSFLTYINDNDRTTQGVKLNLGSIYWSSANEVQPY